MQKDPFKGPRLKIARAYKHLVDLKRAETDFFDQNSVRIRIDVDPQSGHRLAKIVVDAPPPEIIHVIAGDLIYQIRSALDQIAVALARLSAASPNPANVHFPSGDSVKGFQASCSTNLKGFDQAFIDHISKMNIYNGGNDDLRAVFEMANVDKHMELIAIETQGGISMLSNFTIQNGHTGLIFGGPGNLNEGVVFSDLGMHGTITPNNPDAELHVSGQITLGNVGRHGGKPISAFLKLLIEETERAYSGIEALCIATGHIAQSKPEVYFRFQH